MTRVYFRPSQDLGGSGPDEAKELQIRRDRFPGTPWRLRIEVQGDFSTAFPAGTSNLKSDGWLVLEVQ